MVRPIPSLKLAVSGAIDKLNTLFLETILEGLQNHKKTLKYIIKMKTGNKLGIWMDQWNPIWNWFRISKKQQSFP